MWKRECTKAAPRSRGCHLQPPGRGPREKETRSANPMAEPVPPVSPREHRTVAGETHCQLGPPSHPLTLGLTFEPKAGRELRIPSPDSMPEHADTLPEASPSTGRGDGSKPLTGENRGRDVVGVMEGGDDDAPPLVRVFAITPQ
jgi:hypothetical protein